MIHTWWVLLLLAWGAMALVMFALWAYATSRSDASIVDAGWGYGIAVTGVLYATLADGEPAQRALIGILAGLTGIKIGTYVLLNRVIGKGEDGRYQTLRAQWGSRANRRFFVFFQAQGLLDVVLSVPFLVAALNPSSRIGPVQIRGAALWVIATLGETAADRQLAGFRGNPSNSGKVCDVGLWRTSRHPNYFFQILTWVAFALVATPAPSGWIGWISPVIITYSILFVTGIPPTEAQALRSRGDGYRDYQRTTSPLIPWFPRRTAA